MAPVVLAVQAARGERIDVPVIVAASMGLFLLVLVRMEDLIGVLAATLRDREALEEQLRHRAFHDPLTNLANRSCSRIASNTPSPAGIATTSNSP